MIELYLPVPPLLFIRARAASIYALRAASPDWKIASHGRRRPSPLWHTCANTGSLPRCRRAQSYRAEGRAGSLHVEFAHDATLPLLLYTVAVS